MKIAVVNPPWIAIPPHGYGGREKVVFDIVEGMVKKGHDVTLFATGDSKVSANTDFFYPKALGNDNNLRLNPYYLLNHIHDSLKKADRRFDLVHFHLAGIALYFADFLNIPFVFTLHGSYFRDQEPDQFGLIESGSESLLRFKQYPYVSISNKQREGVPHLNYIKTIYNGLTLSDFDYYEDSPEEMIWLGRITYTKGVDIAIDVAKKTSRKLKIACFIDPAEKTYLEKEIEPMLKTDLVTSIAEIKNIKLKSEFLGKAKVFLMPIRWDEPFGIVMTEAMACGTPVVAFAKGSVPEVIKDGETGFIVNFSEDDKRGDWIIKKTGLDGLCEAVEKIYSMPEEEYKQMRKKCRSHVEKNFTLNRMVDDYEKVYQQIIENSKK